jgi:hypothetical protein
MSDNNSFNSVFGSGGGGGGGGTIDSGSNVGTGTIEVFKQAVGSDLEFRTLVDTDSIGLSYVENDPDPLLNSTIEANVILGRIGIRYEGGWYNFYFSLAEAFADAVSGDVIEFFDNVTEKKTRVLNLVDGVDVNLNGYKYTYDPLPVPDNTSMFNNSGTTTNNFRNGTLERKNAIAQTTFGEGEVFSLFANSGEEININLNDCVLINTSRNVISMLGDTTLMSMSGGTIYGGGLVDNGGITSYDTSAFLSGNISNMTFNVTEQVIINTATATNLIVKALDENTSSGGLSLDSVVLSNSTINSRLRNSVTDGTINNCSFYSIGDTTIEAVSSEFQNCTIEYKDAITSSGNEALKTDGCTISNCYVRSDVLFAVSSLESVYQNCSIITTGDTYVFLDNGSNTITNNTIYNLNDNNTGNEGGIYVSANGSVVSNNTIIVSGNLCYAVAGQTLPQDIYYVSNIVQGTINVLDANMVNNQVGTTDTFGNIVVI